jgi:hypothetical protein
LIDDLTGGENFRNGLWQGFQAVNLEATVDLNATQKVKSIQIRCLQDAGSWVWMPTEVIFETSVDGQNWNKLGVEKSPIALTDNASQAYTFTIAADGTPVRYVRITGVNLGRCPDWHLGAGGNAWIMADELNVTW